MRGGFLTQTDLSRINQAAGVLGDIPIYIDDSPAISALEIRAKARRMKMEKGLGLIIIDYLQLMKGRASAERQGDKCASRSPLPAQPEGGRANQ
jgi:replicative DNA helicase